MTIEQAGVLAFHKKFGIPFQEKPSHEIMPAERIVLRKNLINEELEEMMTAWGKKDIVGFADGIGDLLYVVLGTAVEAGIDMELIMKEIQRSNMTKSWPEGTPREVMHDENGKYLKPPTYSPAHLISILQAQMNEHVRFSDCAICAELMGQPQTENEVKDRIIWEDENWVVYPTVGSFVPGYLILSPKSHYQSFSYLSNDLLEQADKLSTWLTEKISEVYGKAVFVAEHGSTMCQRGAACCDHAHLHFIPVPYPEFENVVLDYVDVRPEDYSFGDLKELSAYKNNPYLLVRIDDLYSIWETSDGFSSQFCRKVGASSNGVSHEWNWKTHPGWDNMRDSISRMTPVLRGFRV